MIILKPLLVLGVFCFRRSIKIQRGIQMESDTVLVIYGLLLSVLYVVVFSIQIPPDRSSEISELEEKIEELSSRIDDLESSSSNGYQEDEDI